MARNQKNRPLAVTTPLGPDVLLLSRFTGREELGRVFEYQLELLSEHGDVNFEKILGRPVSVRQDVQEGESRYFHGIVTRIVQSPEAMLNDRRLAAYRAIILPWFWLLTRTQDCRIYQQKSVVDILKLVFGEFGFADFELRLTESYTPRDFCVQYRESYFDFLSRLMEQEGIYYYFEHSESRHVMVLCDSISAHRPVPGYEKIPFKPQQRRDHGMARISRWTVQRDVQSGIYSHGDFDFKKPSARLRQWRIDPQKHPHAEYEFFDYPGGFVETDHGDRYARIRQEEINARHETLAGESDVRRLKVGMTFSLIDHPRADQNKEVLVTSVTYRLCSDEFDTTSTHDDPKAFEAPYAVLFTAIRSAVPFRSESRTPLAKVEGPQTAIVTGPPNNPKEEIYTDPKGHGRVKVRFHWDWHWEGDGKPTTDSSCWVRVSQAWAGKGWGGLQIPRVGQEVIVDFIEGDPDRPMITGRTYNAESGAPQKLPGSKAVSSMRSNTYPGGGGCNEVSMDDTKGAQLFFLQAEKDQKVNIKHDRSTTVGHDSTETVGHDRTDTVVNDAVETIQGNLTEHVVKNKTETVDQNETLTVNQNRTRTVNQNETVTVALMRTHTVGVNEAITVGAAQEVTIGAAQMNSVGAGRISTIGLDDALKVGKKLSIDVGDQITIKTGEASITMKKDGTIVVSGKDITFKASGKIVAKAAGDVTIKGSKIAKN